MSANVAVVDRLDPSAPPFPRAVALLRQGRLVAFPTETVYGLGANALDAAAVTRIFAAKGRPSSNPLIVHVRDLEQARELTAAWPAEAERLARRFWPGPLSLVLPRRAVVPDVVTAGLDTVAIRVPAHPVAQCLLQACRLPIAAPSANPSMGLSPTRAWHVVESLDDRVDLVLDGGACSGGLESTVLDLTSSPARILRPGLATRAMLEAEIGPIAEDPPRSSSLNEPCRSPGMQARHYAPRTPLEVIEDNAEPRLAELLSAGFRVGLLAVREPTAHPQLDSIKMPTIESAYAADLYAALHDLDARRLDRIVVELPMQSSTWHAIRDRLRRAAHDVPPI
jgi:L-threonylcarbamoyladenylate synthase